MRTKTEMLRELKTISDRTDAIRDRAEQRGYYTDDEAESVHRDTDALKVLTRDVKRYNGDQAVKTEIDKLTYGDAGRPAGPPRWAAKERSPWSKNTAAQVTGVNSKAVTSGAYEIGTTLQSGVERMPEVPARLLDLLVNRRSISEGNTFSFLRQSVRQHNADVVADEDEKPVSIYSFDEVEDRVRVVAHLSEPTPLRLLSDVAELEEFLTSEMEEGLSRAVERQIVSGDGEGENMRGLLNTSGIAVQSWDGDLLRTLRRAATNLEIQGETPTGWCLHPGDVEALDLLADNEARGFFGGPNQRIGQSAPIWSVPITTSVAVPPGTALLADWSRVQLVIREQSKLDVDVAGELFRRNLAQLRLETRVGIAVTRPSAVCQVATSATATDTPNAA